ncbi:hypothetical protein [Chloroflexus aurantiacus]
MSTAGAAAWLPHAKLRDTRMMSEQGNQYSELMVLAMDVSLLAFIPVCRKQDILPLLIGKRSCARVMVRWHDSKDFK